MSSTKSSPTPQPKTPVSLSEYVVSWKWLLSGLLFFIVIACAVGGIYWFRTTHLSGHILEVAKKMVAEAEELKKAEKISESLQKRIDATRLLDNFNRSSQQGDRDIQTELNSILESLYKDEVDYGVPTAMRRNSELKNSCLQLMHTIANDKESFPYRIRLMELEWDRRDLPEVIVRAREVRRLEKEISGRENYDALRYLTLVTIYRLPQFDFNPNQIDLSDIQYLDQLLKKVYDLKPGDIEIASRYAEFIVDVTRDIYQKCASKALIDTSLEIRKKQALTLINDMMSRNSESVAAYLASYRFKARFMNLEPYSDTLDDDLQSVLRLDPKNMEGLILASSYCFQQAGAALRAGKKKLSEERKKAGEEFLRQNITSNPRQGLGYQYLGEYLIGDGKTDEAIKVWTEGVEKSNHPAVEELIGRLAVALMEQKRFEDAGSKIKMLTRTEQEAQVQRPDTVVQIRNMKTLLTARLDSLESTATLTKAEEAQTAGRNEESRRLYALTQKKMNDALQALDTLLSTFGNPRDYIIERQSIYARLLPDSLMLAGQLFAELGQWDKARFYFGVANHPAFPLKRDVAALAEANAYQQLNRQDEAVRILLQAAQRSPDNVQLQYYCVQSQFRYQMSRPDPDLRVLEGIEKQFIALNEHSEQLPQPWIVDLRLIHLEMAKANLSNDSEKILESQIMAMRKFRDLEKKELPAKDQTGEKKVYGDDIAFLDEIAGIYSSLAQLADFDRILQKIRELPGGEAAYYGERINDAVRRNDKEGTMLIIEEALANQSLTDGQKQRFVLIMQTLRNEETNSIDKIYARLKTTFDQNPDSLKPQAFFLLGNLALDQEDLDQDDIASAKAILERLKLIDKVPGTWWRYIQARLLLTEPELNYDAIRQLQLEIVKIRKDWDMAYLLKALIEEKYLLQVPDSLEVKATLINAYQEAIRCGCVQPAVWGRLLALLEGVGRTEEAKKVRRDALIRSVPLDTITGQFPQPYQRMYTQVQKAIYDEDPQNADTIAQQCLALAEVRHEKRELFFSLNLALGKLFYDAGILESARRHLTVVAKQGSTNVYPLAVCLAKSNQIDEGFALLLDEINRMPSSTPQLLPSVLVLLSQVRPSEAIFERIDKLMLRIEYGERQVLRGTITADERDIDLGHKRLKSLVVRFPDVEETPDPKDIDFYAPAEEEEEK